MEKLKIEMKDLKEILNLKDNLLDIGLKETENRDDDIVNDDENEWTSLSSGRGKNSLKQKKSFPKIVQNVILRQIAKFNC